MKSNIFVSLHNLLKWNWCLRIMDIFFIVKYTLIFLHTYVIVCWFIGRGWEGCCFFSDVYYLNMSPFPSLPDSLTNLRHPLDVTSSILCHAFTCLSGIFSSSKSLNLMTWQFSSNIIPNIFDGPTQIELQDSMKIYIYIINIYNLSHPVEQLSVGF